MSKIKNYLQEQAEPGSDQWYRLLAQKELAQ